MQAWELHEVRRCIFTAPMMELGELRLNIGLCPHAVRGDSAMSPPVTMEQTRKLDGHFSYGAQIWLL